jgi:hypothetical protein
MKSTPKRPMTPCSARYRPTLRASCTTIAPHSVSAGKVQPTNDCPAVPPSTWARVGDHERLAARQDPQLHARAADLAGDHLLDDAALAEHVHAVGRQAAQPQVDRRALLGRARRPQVARADDLVALAVHGVVVLDHRRLQPRPPRERQVALCGSHVERHDERTVGPAGELWELCHQIRAIEQLRRERAQ